MLGNMATINGTNANNNLNGTDLADEIFGLAGDDALVGFDGDDVLEGGKGADELWGSSGFDLASYRGSPASTSSCPARTADYGDADGRPPVQHRGRGRLGLRGLPLGDDGATSCVARAAPTARRSGGQRHARRRRRQRPWRAVPATTCYAAARASTPPASTIRGRRGRPRRRHRHRGDSSAATAWPASRTSRARPRTTGSPATTAPTRWPGAGRRRAGGAGRRRPVRLRPDLRQPAAAADRILDFSHEQGDRIDLAAVDANDQVLAIRRSSSSARRVHGRRPVRFFQQDGDTVVEANTTDATVGAEMRIVLDPLVTLQASDFVL